MSRIAGIVIFITALAISGHGCFNPDDYDTPRDNVIRLIVLDPVIPADGNAVSRLHAVINRASDLRKVTFTATAGSFVGGDKVVANNKGIAVAFLRSTNIEETSLVHASIAGVDSSGTVHFERAYPDSISIDPGAFYIKAGLENEVEVTAHLIRESGKPTINTPVTFTAIDSSGGNIGAFRAMTPSDAEGQATAYFTAGATGYSGPATIRATVDANGTIVVGEGRIIITQ